MVGKNFSCNDVTGARRKSDLYETPYSITRQLLEVEPFDRSASVLEPARGNGAMVRVLVGEGFTDLLAYDMEIDFLKEVDAYDYVITNPPFSIAKQFILKAKQVARRKIALLLPLSYLHGLERYETIYKDSHFRLATVHVFTRYPMLGEALREDGKYNTGMMVYAWYVWDIEHTGDPVIKWINNQQYILSKRDNV